MIQKDVLKLATSYPDYVNNPNVQIDEMVGFTIPASMLAKIKQDMRRQKESFLYA
jgi:hypothetical protein